MTATKDDITRWTNEAKEKGATHIISVCDTFNYEDYPVFIMPDEDVNERAKDYCGNMQSINEIIEIK